MADLDATKFSPVWSESFDSGLGRLSNAWGHVWAHDGEVTLSSWAGDGYQVNSGFMQPASGASANQGFGLYSITAATDSNEGPGPFACLWPSSDVWPGPELDLFEKQGPDSNTNGYSTLHAKGADGGDVYEAHMLGNIDMSQPHTYAMDWAADHITLYVDGKEIYTDTTDIPQDYAHGGENSAFGAGMQSSWAAGLQNGDNVLHVYDMSYAAPAASSGHAVVVAPAPLPAPVPPPVVVAPPTAPASAPPTVPASVPAAPHDAAPAPASPAHGADAAPAPAPAPAHTGEIDWGATAAAVTAHHEATGNWGNLADLCVYHGGAQAPAPAPAEATHPTAPAPVPVGAMDPVVTSHGGEIDWHATSAAVTAHHDETGSWGHLEDFYVYQGAHVDMAVTSDHVFA